MRILHTLLVLVLFVVPISAASEEFSSKTISIGVIVSDLAASLEFYTEVIGMTKVSTFDIDIEFGKRSGLTGGVPFHVEVLKLGEGDDATQWKLMTFGKSSKAQKNSFIQDHNGVQYITIRVKNMKPFLERIKRHKVKLLGDTPIPLSGENHFVLVKDPDGTFVELIGPMGN